MKLTGAVLAIAISTTGCAAAKSAMGALGGSKPAQVTVTNHVETAPVTVHVAQAPEHKTHPAAVIAGGVAAGAAIGAITGMTTGHMGKSTAVGAGLGALVGGLIVVAR